jgi:hypothetical protein
MCAVSESCQVVSDVKQRFPDCHRGVILHVFFLQIESRPRHFETDEYPTARAKKQYW